MNHFTHVFTALIIAITSLSVCGQSKINGIGLIRLQKYNEATKIKPLSANQTEPMVSVIVSLEDNAIATDLSDAGYNVNHDFNSHAIVSLPISRVEKLAELPSVRHISFGGKRRKLMDFARAATGVDNAHTGITVFDETSAFKGNNVVLGLYDCGLDPNHPNFKKTDGTSRVSRLWHYASDYTTDYTLYTPETISTFTTDDDDETHATHVAGIMGGSYNSTGKYVKHTSASTGAGTIMNGNIPFYGVAPAAELAFSCGSFSDEAILAGVKNIADYASSVGKPAVINLSLGSNYGPHDGTDDFSAALDEIGKDAIICVAAGNEGSDNISIHHECTTENPTVKTILYYNGAHTTSNTGYLDIWASDSRSLTVTVANVNSSGTLSNSTTLKTSSNGTRISNGIKSTGSVYYYTGVDPNNNRYNALLDLDSALPASGRLSITVTGQAGQEIDMYYDGYSTFSDSYYNNSTKLAGYTAGTPDQSISGMACGKNIIAVGSFNTLASFRSIGSSIADSFGETLGEITSFSSYGTDFLGNKLPHVLAPGSAIISSYSRRYVAKGYDYETAADMCASTTYNGNTEYWGPMQGTSMATPFMSGVASLWLSADLSMSVEDIKKVISLTSTQSDSTSADIEARQGAGKVNAEKGLQYILTQKSIGAIGSVNGDDLALSAIVENGSISLVLAGSDGFDASLTDLQGRTILKHHSATNTMLLPTSGLQRGIYILRVFSGNHYITRKLTL